MAEVRSGFQKLVENGCTPRRRRGPGSIRGRLKEEGVLTAVLLLPCPYFLIFPPIIMATTVTTITLLKSSACLYAVRQMNSAHKLITQTHDDTKRRHCGPLYFDLYSSQTTEIGRGPIHVTVPLFAETPFFPPYLPLCLNPSPPIPSPPRPLS
uniref:Uncharacterized protein n=1 Tax=Wuchereria bancrofti TaxID=6293 RepID=A0A1I8EI10_WUCBA